MLTRNRILLTLSALSLAVGATAAGCSGNNISSTDNVGGADNAGGAGAGGANGGSTAGTPPATFCQSDKECRDSNQLCDTSRLTCVDCLETSDCGDEQICSDSICKDVTPCSSSKDCDVDQVCSDTLGFCVECVGDNDCGTAQACIDYACFDTCASDKDCRDADAVCSSSDGVCVECVSSADCAEGSYCGSQFSCVSSVCDAGAGFCSNDVASTCNDEGSGYTQTSCVYGCNAKNTACATEPSADCVDGEAGCACYGNGTCNNGLTCSGDVCVDPQAGCLGNTLNICSGLPYFTGTQTVDADNSDFCNVPGQVFTFANSDYQSVTNALADTTKSKATARIAWSSAGLHAFIHVDDASINYDSLSTWYESDNVQLFMAPTVPTVGDYNSYPLYDVWEQIAIYDVGNATKGKLYYVGSGSYTVEFATKKVSGGYDVELLWSWGGSTPVSGNKIGLNIQIGVNDAGSARDFEYGYFLNSSLTDSYCGTANAGEEAPWCDTRHVCTPTLSAKP